LIKSRNRRNNEELYDIYSSPNIILVIKLRRTIWAGHMAHIGVMRGAYRVLVGKTDGKRPQGKPRCRWEANINTLRTGSFKLFKRPFPGFLTILTL